LGKMISTDFGRNPFSSLSSDPSHQKMRESIPETASLSPSWPSSVDVQLSWWAYNGKALGGCEKRASMRKRKQWRRRSSELVNNKSKRSPLK
jgi:hypothetical protein